MESAILTVPASASHTEVPLGLAMKRGFLGHCPNCGKTPLFKSYLKQVAACANCGAEFSRIRADDAAPWLTIIVVGHLFLPLIFFVNSRSLNALLAKRVGLGGAIFRPVARYPASRQRHIHRDVVGDSGARRRQRLT